MNGRQTTFWRSPLEELHRLGQALRHAKLIWSWPLAAVLLAGLGWASLLSNLAAERKLAEQESLVDVTALASSYARNLQRTYELVDLIALHVQLEWTLTHGALRLEEVIGASSLPLPDYIYVTIVDRDGVPQTSTLRHWQEASFADMPVFQTQKTAASDALYIGGPVTGPLSGQTVILFSRRLADLQGAFSGIVLVSVLPDYFLAGYDLTILGRQGVLAILRPDGTILVSRTGGTVHRNPSMQAISLPLRFPTQAGSFFANGKQWFPDQRNRFVGWRAVADYPLVAMVGIDEQEALATYQAHQSASVQAAKLASAVLLIFTLIAVGLSLLSASHKRALETTEKTYEIARESGTGGLFIVRPIRDTQGRIADFAVVDCNQRAADFLRRQREEIIGITAQTMYGERSSRARLIAILSEAVETGGFERDIQVAEDSPLAMDWVHLKAIYENGDLALTVQDISATKARVNELERQSQEDALTRLPNRLWVQQYLPAAVNRAAAHHAMLAVLFLDLDGFKAVNDTLGHPAGDELLRNAARRLKLAVRPHDHVARLGGDEFVIILEDVSESADVAHVAQRVTQAFKETFRLAAGAASVGASIGISIFPADGQDADTLIKHADIALYAVKASSKGAYYFFNPKSDAAQHGQHEQEEELRHAVEHNQFIVYYQPRIDLLTGKRSGREALVRWAHPTRGVLEPRAFVPLAEKTGLILRLGERVIDQVCAQIAYWATHAREPLPTSVNVSASQLASGGLVQVLSAALARHGISPGLLEIEAAESSLAGNSEAVLETVRELRRMGIKLMVHNYGTGHSSLLELHQLGVNVLKIDHGLTASVEQEGPAFCQAIIGMAHTLGLRVVAEGVETESQMERLKVLHCDEAQGFYLSKPTPAEWSAI